MMEIPLWIPWLLVPIGGTLLTLQFFKKLVEEARPPAELK
jgi:TRAP-type C4-dicarboxylate transport system permease small subunit